MKCPNCGNVSDSNAKFCCVCGAKLEQRKISETEANKTEDKTENKTENETKDKTEHKVEQKVEHKATQKRRRNNPEQRLGIQVCEFRWFRLLPQRNRL